MASLSQSFTPEGAPQLLRRLAAAAVLLACSLSRANDPVVGEPVPPSPMPENSASVPLAEKLWQDRPLGSLKATLKRTEGELPPNVAAPRLAESGLICHSFGDSRPWMLTSCEWEAPATRHLPLLFEEPNLERLGYTHRCHLDFCGYETRPRIAECLQPLVSGAHFFGTIPIVPYLWGYQSPCEPVYTLGVDRPGSPVCYRKHKIPRSLKGAVYQAGFVTGLVFLIP
ncbi:MAG: hypothetical protein AABP62_29265 [Planctomycetota bacterium]